MCCLKCTRLIYPDISACILNFSMITITILNLLKIIARAKRIEIGILTFQQRCYLPNLNPSMRCLPIRDNYYDY